MKIFFHTDFREHIQLSADTKTGLSNLLLSPHSLPELLEKLYAFFQGHLSYDYLMLSFTNQQKEKSRYYIFPRNSSSRNLFTQIDTPINQQSSLYDTPQCAVRIGSRNDNTPSLSLLKKMLPDVKFSSLRFRSINKYNMISTPNK